MISIHALLAESDSWPRAIAPLCLYFYPRSPCGERRGYNLGGRVCQGFLSTLSLRRATVASVLEAGGSRYFYPRSPCGERRYRCVLGCVGYYFYPRSPCGERRLLNSSWISSIKFLSTLSLRRATGAPVDKMPSSSDFYPRSPCGERPVYTSLSGGRNTFLSTLSLRRATMVSLLICNANFDFYPRSPCGERHGDGQDHRSHLRFLSTLSLRRATWQRGSRITYVEFLSTLSLRRATAKVHKTVGHFCAYETNFMGIASSC